MKQLTFLFLLLCHCLVLSQGEGIEVTFKTISKLDISKLENDPSVNKAQLEYSRKLKSQMEEMQYTLKALKEESSFETLYQIPIGRKINPIAQHQKNQKFYVNNTEYIEAIDFQGQDLLIIEKPFKKEWKLLPETSNVLGYNCKKAELTYKEAGEEFHILAWFAPDINYNFGPKGFHGLPGLILKLERNDVLIFEATKIEPKKNLIVTKPYRGKRTTREAFDNRMLAIIKKMSQ